MCIRDRDYSMRIWLDPAAMRIRYLSPADVYQAIPVSYTHLDVYKRQVRGRAQVDMRHVAQTEYLPSGFGTQDNVAELFG